MFSDAHRVGEGKGKLQIQGTLARKSQVLCLLVTLESVLEDPELGFVGKLLENVGV